MLRIRPAGRFGEAVCLAALSGQFARFMLVNQNDSPLTTEQLSLNYAVMAQLTLRIARAIEAIQKPPVWPT
jgi:hypothetical protein